MHDNAHDPLVGLVGQTVDGKYRVERLIGQGGMGAVFRATHVGTDRPVALKIIASELVGDAILIERFQREARAAGRLRHPHVVDVTDFGVATGPTHDVAYLVMEYLEGETLAAFLRKTPKPSLETIVELVTQICGAMDAAHGAGIVHRDLKPENVWLALQSDGRFHVKVLDFGIAKLRERDAPPLSAPPLMDVQSAEPNALAFAPTLPTPAGAARSPVTLVATAPRTPAASPAVADVALTQDGAFLGTPLYMSPEQCAGLPLDARSDIYSLGVILYEMLAGGPPFSADSPLALLGAHIGDSPPPLAEKRPNIPPAVAALVMATLEKDPENRPASCARLAAALEARTEGLGTLLRQAVAIYLGHFRTLVVLAWPVVLANLLLFLYQLARVLATRVLHVGSGFGRVAPFAGILLVVALSFAIAIAQVLNADYILRAMDTKRKPVSLPAPRMLLRQCLPVFWPNLAVYTCQMSAQMLLTYIGLFGYMAVDGLCRAPTATLASLLPPPDWVTHFRFGYGFLLLNGLVASILGMLLLRRWAIVALVAGFEHGRFGETMRRSSFLTRRNLGTLSAALPLYSLLIYGPLTAANIIVAFVSGWPAEITLAESYSEGYSGAQIAAVGLLLIPLICPLAGSLLTVVYRHLLRWEGEAFGGEVMRPSLRE